MHDNWIKAASRWCWTAGLRSRIAGERTRKASLQEVKLHRILNLRTLHRLQQHPIGSLSSIVDELRLHMFPPKSEFVQPRSAPSKAESQRQARKEKWKHETVCSARSVCFQLSNWLDVSVPANLNPRDSPRTKRKKKVFLLRFVINDKWLQLQFRAGVNVPTAEIVENFN